MGLIWACAFAGLAACNYFGIWKADLLLTAVAVIAIGLLTNRQQRLGIVDWIAFILCGYEVPSLILSQYRPNSVRASWTIALSVLIFLAVRLTIRERVQTLWLAGLLGLVGACLAVTALSRFDWNVNRFAELGLTDLVAFRAQLIPVPPPWVLGEWLTLLLLALAFGCALPLYLWKKNHRVLALLAVVPPALISATLIASCSRAVFASLIAFPVVACLLMAAFRVISIRSAGLLLASSLALLALVAGTEGAKYPGVLTAYAGRHTSQVRSTEGRIGIWHRSRELISAHPLWGVGSSNSGLALLSSAEQDETTGFASRTFSLPVQILVEKGIVGFLLYLAFLVFVAREFVRNMRWKQSTAPPKKSSSKRTDDDAPRKMMLCCFAAGIVAVLFRELTYASLLEHTLTTVLFFTLAALVTMPRLDETA